MSEKPFSIRLSEEEKAMLQQIADQRKISMAEVIRELISKADVVNILAEQLKDLFEEFHKWQLVNNQYSILWIVDSLLQESPREEYSIIKEMYAWDAESIRRDVRETMVTLSNYINNVTVKRREDLKTYISKLTLAVERYAQLIRIFFKIATIFPIKDRERIDEYYSNSFRIRYNEFLPKFEDFLKRASRELGYSFERNIERAGDLPKYREPWSRQKATSKLI